MRHLALLVGIGLTVTTCGGSNIDPGALEVVAAEEFTLEAISGEVTFVSTATIVTDEGTFDVDLTRDGEVTQSRINSTSDVAENATIVSRGDQTFALLDSGWEPLDDFGPLGFVLLLAVPDLVHELAVELREIGEFSDWDDIDGHRAARYEIEIIPASERTEFYTVVGGSATLWLTETGVPVKWSAVAPGGDGMIEWTLTELGGEVEIELPPQLGG